MSGVLTILEADDALGQPGSLTHEQALALCIAWQRRVTGELRRGVPVQRILQALPLGRRVARLAGLDLDGHGLGDDHWHEIREIFRRRLPVVGAAQPASAASWEPAMTVTESPQAAALRIPDASPVMRRAAGGWT